MKSSSRNLTEGVVWKQLLLFFLSIAAGTVIRQLYNAVDGFVVSKYVGTVAFAAVGGSPSVLIFVPINAIICSALRNLRACSGLFALFGL